MAKLIRRGPRKFKSTKEREKDIERVRVNFGNRTRYRREPDDTPLFDRSRGERSRILDQLFDEQDTPDMEDR